jgi:hypothetical protein
MGDTANSQAFNEFLGREWHGSRKHSYSVPVRGRSATWCRSLDPLGSWTAHGLKDAMLKYFWNGKSFGATTVELADYSRALRAAVQKGNNNDVLRAVRDVLTWGGVNNPHRQKRTLDWLALNKNELCAKITDAIRLLKSDNSSLARFDGRDLIMNSAITKVVSLADDDEVLVIYDSRVAAALAFFVARFAEETGLRMDPSLRFAVANERRRNPSTATLKFDRLFGLDRDQCHASMVRLSSKLIRNIACGARPREFEAALFMWGYDVSLSDRSVA